MERVVHVKKDRYTVWIARGSKWGNPYRIGAAHPETAEPMSREDVLGLYKEYIVGGEGRHLLGQLGELEGQTLGCFCAEHGALCVDDPVKCHGQILLKLLAHRRRKIAEKKRAASQSPERVIFCGSREFSDPEPVRRALSNLPAGTVVVSGGARGADRLAAREARKAGLEVEVYPAQWERHGKRAGFLRNEAMLDLEGVRAVVAFRAAGRSTGTYHMLEVSRRKLGERAVCVHSSAGAGER